MFPSMKKKIMKLIFCALLPVVIRALYSAKARRTGSKSLLNNTTRKKNDDEEHIINQYLYEMESCGKADRIEMQMAQAARFRSGDPEFFDYEPRGYVELMGLSGKFYGRFFEWMTCGFVRDGRFTKCKIPIGYPLTQVVQILKNEYLEATNVTPTHSGRFFCIEMTIPVLEPFSKGAKNRFHITAAMNNGVKEILDRMTPEEWMKRCSDVIADFTKSGFCKIGIHHVSEGGTLVLSNTPSSFQTALVKAELVHLRSDKINGRRIPFHISIDNY
jgi:hypothetical protein